MKLFINGVEILHNNFFAYDGCHKIYIIEDGNDYVDAQKCGYAILPIEMLREAYMDSCGLRFISNWKLDTQYVLQGEIGCIEWKEA